MLDKVYEMLTKPPKQPEFLDDLQHYISINLIEYIYRFIISITQFFQRIMLVTPTEYLRTREFWQIYDKMFYLSLAILAIVACILALMKLKGEKIRTGKVLNKLMIYILAVILMPYILFRMIEIFNRISILLINTNGMRPPHNADFGVLLGIVIFMILYVVLLVRLILFYAERMIWIVLFAILIPIIFALWCLPQYSDMVKNWFDKILGLLMAQVIHAIILLILGTIVMGASGMSPELTIIYQVGALSVMNKVEGVIRGLFKNNQQILLKNNSLKDLKKGVRTTTKGVRKARKGAAKTKTAYTNIKAMRRGWKWIRDKF